MVVSSVILTFRDNDNLNIHKEYYNDLPGKLAPEILSAAAPTTKQTVLIINFI